MRTGSTPSRANAGCTSARVSGEEPTATPEGVYVQALLLALANPYGFLQGQLDTVIRYVQEYSHWVKLTDVAPVHRMAKAVAIIPVGHDFPPFSASKGGSIEGSKIFLLAFDLAFQIQEQVRKLEAGGDFPADVGKDMSSRRRYLTLLKRLLRQWAIPPARQFNRLPSQARVVMCTELLGVWQYSRGRHSGVAVAPKSTPPLMHCQVINHTPAGYALRQTDAHPPALRIGELVAMRVEGRAGPQVAIVRWFRNTMRGSGLEFGCEVMSDNPEAAAAAHGSRARRQAGSRGRAAPRRHQGRRRRHAAADRRRRGRLRHRSGRGAHPRRRDGIRRADQARRAGTRFRDLRLRRSRLIAAPGAPDPPRIERRPLAAKGGRPPRGAGALRSIVGALARAAQARRLLARAEGLAARLGSGFRFARGERRARQIASLLLPLYAGEGIVRALTEQGRHAVVAAMATALALAALIALLLSFRADAGRSDRH